MLPFLRAVRKKHIVLAMKFSQGDSKLPFKSPGGLAPTGYGPGTGGEAVARLAGLAHLLDFI